MKKEKSKIKWWFTKKNIICTFFTRGKVSFYNLSQFTKKWNLWHIKMKKEFLIANEFLAIVACLSNLTTLQFVVKNFNLKTHVFTLLFLDSLSSTVCSIASAIFETIFFTKILEPNFIICSWSFLVAYIPNCFGAILTLLILKYMLPFYILPFGILAKSLC